MGKMSRITWPQQYAELQRIDELLLCGICYDYMKTSVMTPCSHNYCSLCIRKYLHYKTQCPACFEKTFEKDLHTNRILDELILYFGKIREKLVDCIAGATVEEQSEAGTVEDSTKLTPVRPARSNQNQKKTPSPKGHAELNGLTPKAPRNIEKLTLFGASPKMAVEKNAFAPKSPFKTEKASLFVASPKITEKNEFASNTPYKVDKLTLFAASPTASPSTSNTTKVAKIFTPKNRNKSASCSSNKMVPCPVCSVEVSEVNVNKHLDDCLKRETTNQQRPRIEPKRKPLPKLVFSLMKDAELRKKMKELGLPSQGDRKTLETRFQRYSILYNAECDKIEPRSVDELLKQCEEEENLEKKMLKFAQAANRLKVTRNSEHNVIDEAQKKYLETNKQHFDSLIAAIKDREKSSKLPVRRSLIDQNNKETDGESEEKKVPENSRVAINESESEDDLYGAYSMLTYDSDSSSCCPLQHYTSDDPIQFALLQMTNCNSSNSPSETPTKSGSLVPTSSAEKTNSVKDRSTVDKAEADALEKLSTDSYKVMTDNESNDEDIVPPSPKAATRGTSKRMKLSQQTPNKAEPKPNLTEGKKLALSIIQSFTFDDSSNESLSAKLPTHETVVTKTTELPKEAATASKVQSSAADVPNGDKENHESAVSSAMTVNRPVRKRNSANTTRKNNTVESTRLPKESAIIVPKSSVETDAKSVANSENPRRIDSPLKRRRGRKPVETPLPIEPTNPPRRPLRIRKPVATDSAHKRT